MVLFYVNWAKQNKLSYNQIKVYIGNQHVGNIPKIEES